MLPAVQYDDPWAEAAAETGSDLGRLLKFIEGKFLIGEDEVQLGTEYVAHVNQIARGYVKFLGGKPVDRVVGMLCDGFKMPKREQLPDNDKASWEKDDNGNPRDPWTPQWFLPLISVQTGDFVTFVGGSDGADQAMGKLCALYSRKKHTGQLPIVALRAGGYTHKRYKQWIDTPEFSVVGWDGMPTVAAAIPMKPAPEKATVSADPNDAIPY